MASNVRIVLRSVRCADDTEEGKDELYLLVAGSLNNAPFSKRLPGDSQGHWSIEDNNRVKRINHDMHFAHLNDEDALYLQVVAQEADGQAPADTLKVAAEIASKIPNVITMGAAQIVKAIPFPKNRDDRLGEFSVRVSSKDVEWAAGSGATLERASNATVQIIHCTGTSTKYWLELAVHHS